MEVTRRSPWTGKLNTLDLDVTQEQLDELASPNRRKIQEIFSNLPAPEREFLFSGYTPEDWKELFPPEEQ